MVKRHVLPAVLVAVLSVAALAFFHGTTGAQEGRLTAFDRVEVITYASGLTGFFDRDTGALYIYDSSWDKCIAVRRLNRLGSPMANLDKVRR